MSRVREWRIPDGVLCRVDELGTMTEPGVWTVTKRQWTLNGEPIDDVAGMKLFRQHVLR